MKLVLQTSLYWILGVLLLCGCVKEHPATTLNLQDSNNFSGPSDPQIEEYVRSHNMNTRIDPSGLYYQILNEGDSTSYMTLENIPTITYTRRFLNDKLIDVALGPTDFNGRRLKDHIAGWQIGLRKIAKGGKIIMIIPPYLGFGNVAVDQIPANSILVCEVQLVDFK